MAASSRLTLALLVAVLALSLLGVPAAQAQGDPAPKPIAVLDGPNGPAEQIVFSPDGLTLATAANGDRTVYLWDALTGEPRGTLDAHDSSIVRLVFSPDGTRLAVGQSNGRVALWDLSAVTTYDGVFHADATSAGTSSAAQAQPVTLQFGDAVTARSVNRNGCPMDASMIFSPADQIYVVAPESQVPAGTTVFVRLYYNGSPIEDAPEITAEGDYTNTCVNFVFEPTAGSTFEPGVYEAEFFVNGNAADRAAFIVK